MATITSTAKISVSLADAPHRNYAAWCKAVAQFAMGLYKLGNRPQYGLLGFVIPAVHWQALPGNFVGGVVIPLADPQEPAAPAGNAAGGVLQTYRDEKELFQAFVSAQNTLREAILESIGTEIQRTLQDPNNPYGIILLTSTEIMAEMEVRYGTLAGDDIAEILRALDAPLTDGSTAQFRIFTATFQDNVNRLQRAGQPLSTFTQVQTFQNATKTQVNVAHAIDLYRQANPLLQQQNIAQLAQFVEEQLPNMTTAQLGYASHVREAITTPLASEFCYSALAVQLSGIEAALAALKSSASAGRGQRGDRGRGGRHGRNQPGGRGRTGHLYCYLHGTNDTHAGRDCRGMARNGMFTDAQIAATSSTQVPGGRV